MIIIPLMLLVSCWPTSKLLAGEEIQDILIETYFSEDYSKYIDSFEDRSIKTAGRLNRQEIHDSKTIKRL